MRLSVKDLFGEDINTSDEKAVEQFNVKVEQAKLSCKALMKDNDVPTNYIELLDGHDLEFVENGIKKMNEFADKCWLLSSILVYTLIYDKQMYSQSGLDWISYVSESRERLGIEPADFTVSICSARFFIKHHHDLLQAKWNPVGSRRKLARAELALELCGDLPLTINHIVNDSWREFFDWYSAIKNPEKIAQKVVKEDMPRSDIVINNGKVTIKGKEVYTVSDDLDKNDASRLNDCIVQFFKCLQQGYYPAVISTYNENEAKSLVIMRDKRRGEK